MTRAMDYYLRIGQEGMPSAVWKIGDDVAIRVGVSNAEHGPGTYFKAKPGETIWATIREHTPWFEPDGRNPFHKIKLRPGEYYPRIARPGDQYPNDVPGLSPGALREIDFVAVARGQLTALTRQLDRICQTVQPLPQNFHTFGHDIRNLLILACSEVEAHWRGVLTANGMDKDRYTTQDYVLLRRAMKLDEYSVTFPNYPWLKGISPFKDWGSGGRPTQELKWYAAYNAVKHNRDAEFDKATLFYVFEAISASVVMMAAQFGLHGGLGQRSELQAFYQFSALPSWPPSEVYVYPYGELTSDWSPVLFDFSRAITISEPEESP
jgi:hypothetical protein